MSPKRLVFVFRSPPYGGHIAQEGLDALLAAAVFDQSLSVIFMGDGLFQVLQGQTPTGGKNQLKMLQSLHLYDIRDIYFQSAAMATRNISAAEIGIQGTQLSDAEITQILAQADHIFSF